MAQKPKLRLRFVFNQRLKRDIASTEEAQNATLAILKNVAYDYRQGMLSKMNGDIRRRIAQDAERELTYLAAKYRRSVIGISGSYGRSIVRTDLDTVAGPSKAIAGREALLTGRVNLNWQARTKKYMQWKASKGYGTAWFKNEGVWLKEMQFKQGWVQYFGPVRVTIVPSNENITKANIRGPKVYGKLHLKVATIGIKAMSHLTPRMLPGLSSPRGDINQIGNHRALMNLLPDPIKWRLGREPYRPTLEPFLTFALTRAIPNAMYRRIEMGFRTRTINQSAFRA